MDIEFYDNYLSILSFSDICKNQEMKDQYIRNKLTNDFVYKFISLDDSKDSNYNKIKSLENRELWVSNIKYFEDKSEFKHTYNLSKVSKMTDRSPLAIKNFIDTTEQMNDVSCFTYEMSEYMWKHYANNRKGFCLKFQLLDSDKFFPVIYCRKRKIDFTSKYISAFNEDFNSSSIQSLAILPWVLKNESFKDENELRFLYGAVYDDEDGPLGGRIFANKKEQLEYKGIAYSYNDCGIQLKDIIIGENCSQEYREKLEFIKNNLTH